MLMKCAVNIHFCLFRTAALISQNNGKKLWGKNGSHISNGSLKASLQLTRRTALMNGAKTKQQWWQTSQNAIYGHPLPQEKQADFNV